MVVLEIFWAYHAYTESFVVVVLEHEKKKERINKYLYVSRDAKPRFRISDLNQKMSSQVQVDKCANCWVYDWKQANPASLQKCGRCRVVQYCSKSCQEEHWVKVHKKHCKKLSRVQEPVAVSLFSQHPFPKEGVPGDNLEAMIIIIQRILVKMREDKHQG